MRHFWVDIVICVFLHILAWIDIFSNLFRICILLSTCFSSFVTLFSRHLMCYVFPPLREIEHPPPCSCPWQRCADVDPSADADGSASFLSVCGWTQTQPYVQLWTRTRTRLTEFVNCTYAINANKAAIFKFLVSFYFARNASNVSAVTYCLYWWRQLVMWHRPIYRHVMWPCVQLPFPSMFLSSLATTVICNYNSQSHFDATHNLRNGNQ